MITLYEIDVSSIIQDLALNDLSIIEDGGIYRLHGDIKLTKTNIFWKGKEYLAAPIAAEGYETTSKGVLPTPKLSLSTYDEGVPLLSIIKQRIRQLDNLAGAKVTRIRTFAKYLDAINFIDEDPPAGFSPDPSVEYPRDIYYIERKSQEDKNIITFELSSLLDLDGVKLPGRLVIANSCQWQYRGCGCLYEYASRRNEDIHGKATESWLPEFAPAVANSRNEYVHDVVGGSSLVDKGEFKLGTTYFVRDQVYITKNGIKHYFVCKANNNQFPLTNRTYWFEDECAKDIPACRLRYKNLRIGATPSNPGGIGYSHLPFGGFPATSKL